MTIREAAELALVVQDACNLSGVAHGFSRVLTEALWPEANRLGLGTEYVNQHPVSQLFADKLADLARVRDMQSFSKAYDDCKALAGR